jgi:orotate phosphoribosyltransferase
MDEKAELAEILRKNSYFSGEFVLASGRHTTYYFDCKLTTYSEPRGLELAAALILDQVRPLRGRLQAIGGLTLGAAPLAIAVSQQAWKEGWRLPAFAVRKEPKQHGRQRLIEGTVEPAWEVAILDDVITSGDSVHRAISAVCEAGAKVAKVIVLVDREEGGRETLREYDYSAIFTIRELLEK